MKTAVVGCRFTIYTCKKGYLHKSLSVVFFDITVLCTAPSRYIVVDSDGIIKPRCCIDMYVINFVKLIFIICFFFYF